MRVFNYIQRFNLKLRHKFDVQHIIFDVFSRLISLNTDEIRQTNYEKKLNILFVITINLIEMNEDFRNRLMIDYLKNST